MIRCILAVSLATLIGLCLSGVPSASAETPFPFKAYVTVLDFSEPETVAQFESMVEEIGEQSFVYLDWQIKSGWKSEVFDILGDPHSDAAEPDANLEPEMCTKLSDELLAGGGRVEFGGRPNPDNNHLLMSLTVRLTETDPFAITRCEYHGDYTPRIRGFFYVTEDRIATANQYELRPVTIDAASVPADFFQTPQP